MNQQKATLFVLIVLVVAFFLVSMVMISKNGELQSHVLKLGDRVRQLEAKMDAVAQEAKKNPQGR